MAEGIDDARLKDICNQVLLDILEFPTNTTVGSLTYIPPKKGEAVIREAPVYFKCGIQRVTLLRCRYKLMEFYLAQGAQTDVSVFRLDRNATDNFFYFESGLHKIEE